MSGSGRGWKIRCDCSVDRIIRHWVEGARMAAQQKIRIACLLEAVKG